MMRLTLWVLNGLSTQWIVALTVDVVEYGGEKVSKFFLRHEISGDR